MRPCSSTTSTPSSIVLKRVSRKLRSRASRRTTVWSPCSSNRPMRPRTLSRKLDFGGIAGVLQPTLSLEIEIGRERGKDSNDDGHEIAMFPAKFRHGLEIHAVPGGDHH